MSPPGKIKRRFRNTPGHSHYYTTSTDCREPFLKDDRVCQALADRINKAAEKHNFVILAYVFMPDHIHLLIHPLDEVYSMEVIVKAIKQGVSNRAKSRGWIPSDLWEVGGGYDRNIFTPKARKTQSTISTKMPWSRILLNPRSITSGLRPTGISPKKKGQSNVDTMPAWSKTCYNASVPATNCLSLHKLGASHVVAYTGHPQAEFFTPPTQWFTVWAVLCSKVTSRYLPGRVLSRTDRVD